MTTPKRHGLWQFHRRVREVSEYRKRRYEWWTSEGKQQIRRDSYTSPGYPSYPYRPTDAIVRCANRALRRFNLPRNVETWNKLCETIWARMGAGHPALRAATIHSSRPRTPIRMRNPRDDLEEPHPAWEPGQLVRRLERLQVRQKLRDRQRQLEEEQALKIENDRLFGRLCTPCDAPIKRVRHQIDKETVKNLELPETWMWRYACPACNTKITKLRERFDEAVEMRRSVRAKVRELNQKQPL